MMFKSKIIKNFYNRISSVLIYGVIFGLVSSVAYAYSTLSTYTIWGSSSNAGPISYVHADDSGSGGDGSCDGAGGSGGDSCGCGW